MSHITLSDLGINIISKYTFVATSWVPILPRQFDAHFRNSKWTDPNIVLMISDDSFHGHVTIQTSRTVKRMDV